MKKQIQSLIQIILLTIISVSGLVAQPSTGVSTFDGAFLQLAGFGPSPRTGSLDGWTFTSVGAGSGFTSRNGSGQISMSMQTPTYFSIGSDDGSEFQFDNINIEFFLGTTTYTITGYRDGAPVSGAVFSEAVVNAQAKTIDVSSDTDFENIDEFRFTFSTSPSSSSITIEDITISAAAAANTPPTATSFTAANGPYENLTYTFSTSDFGYSDGDGDPINHLLIESLPGAGTIYVDADNDDTYDGGEELSVSDQVSKADLDAGNLQYIQNGSTSTSFQFEVNDGTDNSSGNYKASLNVVGVPTVTLSINPSSRVEGVSANVNVTATLSNSYGVNTNVALGFSGTATNSVDYTRSGTSIPISAGSTSGSITLSNQNDIPYEGNETVVIDISGVTGGKEDGVQQVTYTIIDDDPQPSATLLLRDIYNPITDESGGQAYIVGELSYSAGVTVTIPLTFSGTATGGGTDYGISGSSIVISPGNWMDSIRVTSLNDEIEEGDETIIIDMGTPTNAVESGTQQVTVTIKDEDALAPSGYTISIDQNPINAGNESSVSFTFAGAEVGADYDYTFSSSGGGTNVTGSGTIATATDQISGIDLSGLGDGTITLSVTLTDAFGNTGTAAADTKTKDTAAPTGYAVAIDQAGINATNTGNVSFTFTGAEVGADYNYTFSSSGGGTNVTGSGTIAIATDQITGLDISGLGDGTITLSATLTDANGNAGSVATDNVQKDIVVPTGYSVAFDVLGELQINVINESIIEFSGSGLEVGTTLNYSFTSDGGGTPVTGTETVTTASQQFDNSGAGYDLSGLTDGTVTLTVTLTDAAGNTGADATDSEAKDSGPPTGYSVAWDDALINASEASTATFTVTNAEVGTTINNTVSSSGDGNTATVSNPTVVTSNTQVVTVDVSSLVDGTLTVEVSLTDGGGNTGGTVSDNSAELDQTIPSGYGVAIDQANISAANQGAISFTFSGAEVGTTYDYTFSSSAGGPNVTGTGTVVTASDQITGVDLSGIADGTITLSVTLSDAANNVGAAVTDNVQKDADAPTFVSVDDNGGDNSYTSGESLTIVADLAEIGLTVTADLSVINPGFSNNYPMNDNGDGTYSNTVGDVDAGGNLIEGASTAVNITATDASGNQSTDNSLLLLLDKTAPSGYSVTIDQTIIDATNQAALSFNIANAEVGTTYDYAISSNGGGTDVTGSGIIGTATDQITGVDLSGLGDGTLTLSITLTDAAGNTGAVATDNIAKDIVVPSGYSVSIELLGESFVNVINQNIIEFTGSGLEVGTTLNYTFTSDGGGTPVSGTETVTNASQQFNNSGAGYDLSGLTDGTVTLTISLTDNAGNTGDDTSDTANKDIGPPTGYTVAWDEAFINASESGTATFTVSNAEIGSTINNSVSSSGDGNTATVSSPITVTSTTQIITIDVSSLDDGVLTVEVSLTDAAGNTGGTVSDNAATLDQTAPSGYSVSIDQADISAANQTATSFTFAGAEVGTTYNYMLSSSAGGTDVTGSGTIATATDQITGVDLSGLADGTITLSVTLTDPAGNEGTAASDNVSKDTTAPNFISVDDDGGDNSYKSGESLSLVADLGETGLTVTADLSVINSGLSATAAMTDNSDGTYSLTVADVDNGGDMIEGTAIAVPLIATDGAGNQQTDNSLTLNLDKTAPAGYTVSVDQSIINASNQASMSFTFASAEVGATYNYTISSDGGGTAVTGSESIGTASDQITGIDVSGLGDGTLTLSITLTDAAGNTGAATTDEVNKVTAAITFNATGSSGDESVANANIQVDLSILSAFDVTVDYSLSGTANGAGSDYTLANGTLTIASGNESGIIEITGIVDDEIVEGAETIILTLSNPTNASLGSTTEFIYTINDNDKAEISVVATNQAAEDDVNGLYTISTSKEFANEVVISFSISGTATEVADYEEIDTSIVFPASTSSITIPIVVKADTEVEDDETVIITLESTDNTAVLIGTDNSATVIITDNDEKLPQIITFDPISDKNLSDKEVILEGSGGDSGEPITYTISTEPVNGVATLSNGIIMLEGIGTVTVTASQAGNDSYLPAEDVSQSFSILSDELLLPTLFTPNNDRINDVLFIRGGAAVQSVNFRIFNRKGNLVYESNSFQELSETGWDGRKNGVNQPAGTYVWVISGTMSNGEPIKVNGSNRGTILIAR
ncbi:Calx-beta domain-containing protein [Marivirga salinae]|uniref:Calx-beta domain-containing protein n=1 Tax=Marivirga salinarum TaxID=3059078 RepID=A0AA51RBS7_9BACT|nr:Calx-beta domain-containing protein [Marivirga sp. BDSF4-3]WMN12616.1 Calx-beta domain-containing protein [Marivirga sp. BDSF4-3]